MDAEGSAAPSHDEAWERLKVYSAWAEISRRWTATMDAKAAFVTGLDGAVVAFLWSGVGFAQVRGPALWLALAASALTGVSLWFALTVVLPRTAVSAEVRAPGDGGASCKPLSYFGFVATAYPAGRFAQLRSDAARLDLAGLADEALEQHHTISLVALKKSRGVRLSGLACMVAIALAVAAMASRGW